MCGRFARRSDKQRIAKAFHLGSLEGLVRELAPSYNIAPRTMQPVIVNDRVTDEQRVRIMRWGTLPTWTKTLRGYTFSTINAKAEDIIRKPMWKKAFESRRCLVPADLFYEWSKSGAKTNQPYAYAMRDDAPFAFAALWDTWREPGGLLIVDTFCIVTTEANELAARVHSRMPVILEPQNYNRWLTTDIKDLSLVDLLRPYEAELMRAWKVDSSINNARNNEPRVCAELD